MEKRVSKYVEKSSMDNGLVEYYNKPENVKWEDCKEELLKEHDIMFTDDCRYPIKIIWRRDPKEGDDTALLAFGHIVFYNGEMFFKQNENGTYTEIFDTGLAEYMIETLQEVIDYTRE